MRIRKPRFLCNSRTAPIASAAGLNPIMQILKAVSLGNYGNAKLARQVTVPRPVIVSALSGVPAGALRGTVSASDAAANKLDVVLKIFKNDSGRLTSISLEHDKIKSAISTEKSIKWDGILNPLSTSKERDIALSDLFDLPLSVSALPQQEGPAQPQYQSALIVLPSTDSGSFTDIRLSDPFYSVRTEGERSTFGHRTFLQEDGADISPWHDVPLYNKDGTLNFFCEIPKDTTAKFEVATAEHSNPIKQDVKKGELRHYHNKILWNYGMLPQTWEDPAASSALLPGIGGDCDPLDVVEMSGSPMQSGGVYHVKFLGAFAMIDGGELDWKIICINVDSPLAAKLDTIQDVERELPGELERILEWFRTYKVPDGKPESTFGFGEKPIDKDMARLVISETHDAYKELKEGQRDNVEGLSLR